MDQGVEIFIALVKSEICKTVVASEMIQLITGDILPQLYMLAQKQDLVHIVAVALKKLNVLGDDEVSKRFLDSIYLAVVRYERIKHEQNRICEVFEQEQIVFLPLKGAVIRDYYPEAWMRTSCDIDILVHEEKLEKAVEILVDELGYKKVSHNYHDVSLYSPAGVHLELHFTILEHEKNIDQLLARVWEFVSPIEEGRFQYEMTPEYWMFHLLAHMSYHFSHGGCGVRPLIDIWLLENALEYDRAKVDTYCELCGIRTFSSQMFRLVKIWFEDMPHDEISEKVQLYLISGGIYGTKKSQMAASKTKVDGKVRYILRRIFMPYESLCILFPKLKKNVLLYPYYTVKRWGKLLKDDTFKRVTQEAKLNFTIEQEAVNEVATLFKKLGL